MVANTDLAAAGAARTGRHRAPKLMRHLIVGVVAVASLLWTAAFGYYFVFSRFSWYDDEGYLMVSVQQFLRGKPLYDAVYSQYGPFYYVSRSALLLVLGLPLSHDVTRLITLATWLAVAVLCAWWIWRATRSASAALAVYLPLFLHLRDLAAEPGHPQELALCLLALSVLLAALLDSPRQATMFAVVGAFVAACLVLTKINLGAYLAAALLLTGITFGAEGRTRRIAFVGLIAGTVLLPWALMHAQLASWAFRYAVIASFSSAAVGVTCLTVRSDRPFTVKHVAAATAASLFAVLAVCLVVLLRGTSPSGLLDGVVFRPLAFSSSFYLPRWIPKSALVCSAASLLLAFGYATSSRGSTRPVGLRWAVWTLKLAGGIVGVYLALVPGGGLFDYAPSLLWLVLVRPVGAQWSYRQIFPRVALTTIAALQFLHAYPVAGSQVSWATFLMIPAMVVCLVDALSEMTEVGAIAAMTSVPLRRMVAVLAVVVLAAWYAGRMDLRAERSQYEASVPLSLPGAARIRLPADEAARYYWLSANLRAHCSTFVTMPGSNSLYFWSEQSPPTGFNGTAWMILLRDDEQQAIVDRMRAEPNACVVENQAGTRAGVRGQDIDARPLPRFIHDNFRPAWELAPTGSPTLRIDGIAARYSFEVARPAYASTQPNYFIYGTHSFAGDRAALGVPADFIAAPPAATYDFWFRTEHPGVLLGCQSTPRRAAAPEKSAPLIYVGRDGRLRTALGSQTRSPLTSPSQVADGRWHHVVVVRGQGQQALWVDGTMTAALGASTPPAFGQFCQAGSGYTASWPEGNGGWLDFTGLIRDFRQWQGAWSAGQVAAEFDATATGDRSRPHVTATMPRR